MARLLYDTTTSTLHPYPRQDDEPVVGLDPRYLEMVLIQQDQPSCALVKLPRLLAMAGLPCGIATIRFDLEPRSLRFP